MHGKILDLTQTHLDPKPTQLRSAVEVSSLLQAIDTCHYCNGNEDERFFPLQAARKGVFKDASGNIYLYSLHLKTFSFFNLPRSH